MANEAVTLETERLLLRNWKTSDFPVFAKMTADPQVMRYFPKTLSREESYALASKIQGLILEKGWGFWAVELKETGEFIGFVGLHHQEEHVPIPNTPFVEIGWRLASQYWRKGYASEAARGVLEYAFSQLGATDVYAFTTKTNIPSQKVMETLGMINQNQDFDHPNLAAYPDYVKRHCLYRMNLEWWRQNSTSSSNQLERE